MEQDHDHQRKQERHDDVLEEGLTSGINTRPHGDSIKRKKALWLITITAMTCVAFVGVRGRFSFVSSTTVAPRNRRMKHEEPNVYHGHGGDEMEKQNSRRLVLPIEPERQEKRGHRRSSERVHRDDHHTTSSVRSAGPYPANETPTRQQGEFNQTSSSSVARSSVFRVAQWPVDFAEEASTMATEGIGSRALLAESAGALPRWLQQDSSGEHKTSFHKLPGVEVVRARSGLRDPGATIPPGKDRCFEDPQGVNRCHANIYLFGVSKCATSSFAAWMVSHPALRFVCNAANVGKGKFSEAHVLDSPPDDWRRERKAGRYGKWGVTAPEAEENDYVIDYTPHYVTVPEVPYRIADLYGSHSYDGTLKYVVLLREPVSRAISSWEFKYDLHHVDPTYKQSPNSLHEHRNFEEAMEDGMERVGKLFRCRDRIVEEREREEEAAAAARGGDRGDKDYLEALLKLELIQPFLEPGMYVAHIAKGLYAMQLQRWFGLFGRENIKVVFLDNLMADPVGTLEDVFTFVGMDFVDENGITGLRSRDEWAKVVGQTKNATDRKKKEALEKQITQELKDKMRIFYAPHNTALEEMLGTPLPASWTTSAGLT